MLREMEKIDRSHAGTGLLTSVALLSFAANSIFCRLALRDGSIDPASFTSIRLASGAIILTLFSLAGGRKIGFRGGWGNGMLLFLYAAPFTYAYVALSAGTGALILFGSVQVTMIAAAAIGGRRPSGPEWTGLLLAVGGLAWLVSPGIEAPSWSGSLLMSVAGGAWGLYSVRGKSSGSPVSDTAGNFLRASLPALALSALGSAGVAWAGEIRFAQAGVWYALASGIVASGLGYAAWYSALRGLTAVRAAVVQLSVPVITAVAGVVLLSETATLRLLGASALVLGGIGIAIAGRRKKLPV